MRKFLILILFIALFSATAYGIAGSYLTELVINAGTGMGTGRYFLVKQGLDEITYVLGYRDGLRLTALNAQERLYERELKKGLPKDFIVDDLHVTQQGAVLLSLYECLADGKFFYGLYVADDSLSFRPLLREECFGSSFIECRRNTGLSSMNEHDGQLRFLLKSGSKYNRYLLKTTDIDAVLADGTFQMDQGMLAAWAALDKTTYVALANGALMEHSEGASQLLSSEKRLYTRFWQTHNGFGYLDGNTGSLITFDYQTKQQKEVQLLADKVLPYQPQDITSFSVGMGDDFWVLVNYSRLYAQLSEGSFTDLTYLLYRQTWQSILILAVFAIVILIVSYGFYYLFSEVRKLYFPIALRSLLVLGLVSLILVYAALNMLILPEYRDNGRKLSQDMLAAYTQLLAESEFNLAAASTHLAAFSTAFDRTSFYKLRLSDEGWRVAHSGDPYYGEGFMMNTPGFLGALAAGIGLETPTAMLEEAQTKLYTAYVPMQDNSLLIAVADGYQIEADIDAACRQLALMMYALTLAVVVAAVLMLGLVSQGLRRIISGMDILSTGQQEVKIIQNSGDELEALANAFNNLVAVLRKRFRSEKKRSDTYLQFIPEQLVSLIGAGNIEEVNKSITTSRDLTIMVVCFSFPDQPYQGQPQKIFDNINEVIERTAGVVAKNGGTISNFTFNSYEAVFDSNPNTVISAAIKIRQIIIALNKERALRGSAPVTLRIAIDKGLVMMGVVGDDTRMAPTAVSPCLSTARMLVDFAEVLDANILCTMVVSETAQDYSIRYIGKVKECNELIRIYELFDGDEYEVKAGKEKSRQQFSEAVYSMYGRDFEASKHLFMDIARNYHGDGVSRYYLHLADKFEAQEPEEVCLN